MNDLLIAEVRIQEYGDKKNQEFDRRFRLPPKSLPELILFERIKDKESGKVDFKEIRYGGPTDKDSLVTFLRAKAPTVMPVLPGCLKEFDRLAERYMRAKSEKEREVVHAKTIRKRDQMREDGDPPINVESASRYVKLMQIALGKSVLRLFVASKMLVFSSLFQAWITTRSSGRRRSG